MLVVRTRRFVRVLQARVLVRGFRYVRVQVCGRSGRAGVPT